MDQIWQEFVQQLLLNAIPIVVPLILAWIVKIAVEIWETIKSQKPDIAWTIEEAANFGINAAEQVGLTGALRELADSKLDYAIQSAEKYLSSKGIKHVDLDFLRAAIEGELIKANFPHGEKTVSGE